MFNSSLMKVSAVIVLLLAIVVMWAWLSTGYLRNVVLTVVVDCALAGCAGTIAEVCTIMIDTAKVRMQTGVSRNLQYTSIFNCFKTIIQEEGVLVLFSGLIPGIVRQLVFCSIRIGTYDHVRNFFHLALEGGRDTGQSSFGVKILAGLLTGTGAIVVAQPMDVVKIKMQSLLRESHEYKALKTQAKHKGFGVVDSVRQIVESNGIIGLWRGLVPNIARNATINAVEVTSYDQAKQTLKLIGFSSKLGRQVLAAFTTGFLAACVGSPLDVIKTRVMQGAKGPNGELMYTGMLHCFSRMLYEEGVGSFYDAFLLTYLRLGLWNLIMFITLEQLRRLVKQPISWF